MRTRLNDGGHEELTSCLGVRLCSEWAAYTQSDSTEGSINFTRRRILKLTHQGSTGARLCSGLVAGRSFVLHPPRETARVPSRRGRHTIIYARSDHIPTAAAAECRILHPPHGRTSAPEPMTLNRNRNRGGGVLGGTELNLIYPPTRAPSQSGPILRNFSGCTISKVHV